MELFPVCKITRNMRRHTVEGHDKVYTDITGISYISGHCIDNQRFSIASVFSLLNPHLDISSLQSSICPNNLFFSRKCPLSYCCFALCVCYCSYSLCNCKNSLVIYLCTVTCTLCSNYI